MMDKEKDIERIVQKVAGHIPLSPNREQIIEDLFAGSYKDSSTARLPVFNYLFGWADQPLLRRALVTVSLVIVLIFSGQQFLIFKRIDKLESRMVESSTDALLKHQERNVLLKSAILTGGGEPTGVDSIMVANKDLRSLIESYMMLQKQYADLESLYKSNEKAEL